MGRRVRFARISERVVSDREVVAFFTELPSGESDWIRWWADGRGLLDPGLSNDVGKGRNLPGAQNRIGTFV